MNVKKKTRKRENGKTRTPSQPSPNTEMSDKPFILAVDRNRRNLELLTQFLEREGYQTCCAANLEEFDKVLEGSENINLALVDLSGFDKRIWGRCERLRNEEIPFLIFSPRQSTAIQQESLAHGARSVLVKPLVVRELMGLIRSLLEV